jgi:DNA-binding XRE family transcriptional regulator
MAKLLPVFREEVTRLARKELKRAVVPLRRATIACRREITQLKRTIRALERQLATRQCACNHAEEATVEGADLEGLRFSARSVRAQRRRLKLTAAEFGQILGVSAQTVYLWERGVTRPGQKHFATLVAARSISRKDALSLLEPQE